MDILSSFSFRNDVHAKNRVMLAPMTNSQSHEDGTLSDEELHWLTMRADGGFGIVMTCAAHVAKDGQGWAGELGVFDDAQIPGLTKIAKNMHNREALAFAQIFHGGLRADEKVSGTRPWSANEVDGGPRAATEDDLARVIKQFADAAVRAHKAGMDGVEIHGAHGYLLTQFLSPIENTRTDSWGGSLENRARLVREVTRAVRACVPKSFVVGVRLSPEDFGNAKGMDLDESVTTGKWLADDGADFIHLSLWRSEKNSRKRPDEHAITAFKKVLPPDVRIFAAGNIWTRAEAENLLELGADGVALGRSAIANPDWPLRVIEKNWEPKRPPLTVAELEARGLSPAFAAYMRNWKNFVAD
jgi:2,4-dienoyl-CoA reductase-like NADH-dependent reductase (Old Yellow Enzyme family)